jgi:hypothetical protein
MTKTAPLVAKQAVIKSPGKKPVKPKAPAYADFDKIMDLACRLTNRLEFITDTCDRQKPFGLPLDQLQWMANRPLPNFDDIRADVAEVNAAWAHYDRAELYEIIKNPKARRESEREKRLLRRSVVAEQMALLIACFPNAAPAQRGCASASR